MFLFCFFTVLCCFKGETRHGNTKSEGTICSEVKVFLFSTEQPTVRSETDEKLI